MADRAEASGSLALSRRPRALPRSVPAPAFGGAKALSHSPAEIAQARVFERLLQAECVELQELAHRTAVDQQSEADDSGTHGELAQIHARIDEIDGLLRALRGRFPRSAPDGDR